MQIARAGLKKSKFEFVAVMIAAITIPAHASTIPGWQCPRRSHRQRKHQYQHGLDSRFDKHSSYGSERGRFHFYVMAGKPDNYIEHLECDTQVICSGTNGESFSLNNAQYSAPANQQIRVILGVDATLWASGAGTVSATLDPIFSIDPGFANAGQYSLVISADVTQAGPQNAQAPEPASAGLAGTGLAAAIWFVLSSRRSR